MKQHNPIILLTDSYKVTHWPFYPEKTTRLVSYLESRGGKFDNTVFNGLQTILKEYLTGQVVTQEMINETDALFSDHFYTDTYFNREGWQYILDEHEGYLPLSIKAVPEGTPVTVSNVMALIESTDPKCIWLTNYVESILLQVWYPITVATLSREVKKVLIAFLRKTTDYTMEEISELVLFMLHDFGFRGVSSVESARVGGLSHLINFFGTDNLIALKHARDYYNVSTVVGNSVLATEHSIMSSEGMRGELNVMRRILENSPDSSIISVVSDTYDIINACQNYWGGELKEQVLEREGRLVIRPDSGDPVETLRKVFNTLWDVFGGKVNDKGFKVLNEHVRVIQGDGVNYESIIDVLRMMVDEGFSVENIVFGMGGALLQKIDRDTQKFAIKACYREDSDGNVYDIRKSPIEFNENGECVESFKTSKAGILGLFDKKGIGNEGRKDFITINLNDDGDVPSLNYLKEVYRDGEILIEYDFHQVRDNAKIYESEIKEVEQWLGFKKQ